MAQKVLGVMRVSVFQFGRNSGFSLLEILVVMFIIGFMTTFGLRVLRNVRPAFKQEQFVDNVRTLLAVAWQRALSTGKVHRVYFDLEKRVMATEMQTNEPQEDKEVFAPITRAYDAASFTWPKSITFKEFYIQGTNGLNTGGRKTNAIWFYVVPDGMVQEVIINIEEAVGDSSLPLSLVINPFTAQLATYETFQKP